MAGDSDSSDTLLARALDTLWVDGVTEVARIIGIVVVVSVCLFIFTGTWPPMVAVQSGSMEPGMERTDLIIVTDTNTFGHEYSHGGTGVVTAQNGLDSGYEKFGGAGDVIVYRVNGDAAGVAVIHRAMFWVEQGENWVESGKADPNYLSGTTCDAVSNCPAPHAGFITKGDANAQYDQAAEVSAPVKPAWIEAKAAVRIPYVGWFRLVVTGS